MLRRNSLLTKNTQGASLLLLLRRQILFNSTTSSSCVNNHHLSTSSTSGSSFVTTKQQQLDNKKNEDDDNGDDDVEEKYYKKIVLREYVSKKTSEDCENNDNDNDNNTKKKKKKKNEDISVGVFGVNFVEVKCKKRDLFFPSAAASIINQKEKEEEEEEDTNNNSNKIFLNKNKILVKVKAFAVNPLDIEVSKGYLKKFLGTKLDEEKNEVVLGKDFSGEIVSIGGGGGTKIQSNRKFKVGDEVFGAIAAADFRNGAYSEYVVVDAKTLMRKPASLTHKEACAIPFAAYTAYACLRTTECVDRKNPKRVLVFGGGSAVGECISRIALRGGFASNVVVTASKASEDLLKEIGVERVIGYASTSPKNISDDDSDRNRNADEKVPAKEDEGGGGFLKSAQFVYDSEPSFDVAIDTVGTSKTKYQAMMALKKGTGTYITLHGEMAQLVGESGVVLGTAQASLELLREKTFSRLQYDVGYDWGYANTNDLDATNLIEYLVNRGLLSVKVCNERQFFGLQSVGEAHAALLNPSLKGKIVVELK